MKIESILALISIVIGLPGFLFLFLHGQQIIGLIVLLIIFIIGFYYWKENFMSSFCNVFSYKKLEIFDEKAMKAKITLYRKVRANHKGLQEYIFRHIRSDGRIENFQSGFGPPDKIFCDSGAYMVVIRFPKALKKGEVLEISLSYDILGGYPKEIETTSLLIDYPTKELGMEILFPKGRPCLEAAACRISGSDEKELEKPEVSYDHTTVKWKIRKFLGYFSRGFLYKIEWKWQKGYNLSTPYK